MTTYKDSLTLAMIALSQDPRTCVLGYNTLYGRAGGTLNGFDPARIQEMPLAENLMCGAAVGFSLEGWIPLIWIERMDFTLCCLDALVNHLGRISELSKGIHRPAAIIRVAVGNSKTPLFTGAVHIQNFSSAIAAMNVFDVIELLHTDEIAPAYAHALAEAKAGRSTMVVEFRDLYAQ